MLRIVTALPHYHYGDVIYGNCSAIALTPLQVLHNRGARMCLDCVDMLSDLRWLSIKDRIDFHKMCLVYKYKNGPVPLYLAKTFSN